MSTADPASTVPGMPTGLTLVVGLVLAAVVLALSVPWVAFVERYLPRGDADGARTGPGPSWPHVGGLVLVYLASSLSIGLASRMLGLDVERTLDLLVLNALIQGATVGGAFLLAHATGDGARALGLAAPVEPAGVFLALVVYVTCLPGLAAVSFLWRALLTAFGQGEIEQDIVARFAGIPVDQRAWPLALGIVIVPLCEELLFRGFLQPVLVRRLGARVGVVLTAVAFASLHGVAAFVPITALALLLGLFAQRTGRIHASWVVHAAHNGLQFVMLYSFPELARP